MVKAKKITDKEQQELLKASGLMPKHIAIIMDGNGRWARQKGFPRFAGHKVGVESVRDIVEACAQIGVEYLTLYTFSTENWNRPKDEVSILMRLLLKTLQKELNELNRNNVRLTTIGDANSLPDNVQEEFNEAIEKTKNNTGLTLVLALSYSGRWEIIEAVKSIVKDVEKKSIKAEDITGELFSKYLTTGNIPDPDLLIRTGNEFRVSNFLLWQIAYTEIFVTDTFWPDFRRLNLYNAIGDFQKRERRFGKVSEQLQKNVKGSKNVLSRSKETA